MDLLPTIAYLTDIHFGLGSLKKLSALLQKLKMQKPLIVTDKGLVKLGFVERLKLNDPPGF